MPHEKNHSLLEILHGCADECYHCASACLEEHDLHMLVRCIKLDTDCAEFCRITASFIARGSEHANRLLAECADICNACADECEKHSHMEHCRQCAATCRNCAEACLHPVEV